MQTALEITKYRHGGYWGVYENGELLCVTVYKKGAQAVVKRVSDGSEDYKQQPGRMFETEDLPLFSGTPVQARENVYIPQPVARQARLGNCLHCFDTGELKATKDGFCLCALGQEKREESRKERTQ